MSVDMDTDIQFLRDLEADLMEAAGAESATSTPRSIRSAGPTRRVMVAVAVAATVLVSGVVGWQARRGSSSVDQLRAYSPLGSLRHVPGPGAPEAMPSPSPVFGPEMDVRNGTGPVSAGPASKVPEVGPLIVKTAGLTLQVKKGGFQEAFGEASLVAAKEGGFVLSSSTGRTSGSLQIRVPAGQFEQTLADLRGLGQVTGETISGQDVSSQYVDLQARIKTWGAQEAVLLKLMGQATTIQDTLRVQGELQNVQFQIERLKGQFRVLQDQAANGTISVMIHEPSLRSTTNEASSTSLPSFGHAARLALAGLLSVAFSVVVGLGYMVPILIGVGLLWLIWRRIRVRTGAA